MSKFHNQLALVSVSVIALVAAAVSLSERAQHRAEEAAEAAEAALAAAEPAATEAEAVAEAPAAEVVEEAAEEVAAAPAEADAPASDEAPADVAAAHGHGDPGTAPIASIIAGAAVAQTVDSPALDATGVMYGLGREALTEEIVAWDIDIRPDGEGLPEGSGDVWTGEEVFIEQCAVCHGDFAEGVDRWPVLAGGIGTLTNDRPIKTIGSYWPYLSTVYDYVNRAMPFGNAQSLEPDQVYAITAYLLYSNGVVEDDFVLSQENFLEVRLPNEENFFLDDRADGELSAFAAEPCMENCKESVEITMRAAVLDVTPEDEGSGTAAAEIAPTPAVAEDSAVEATEAAAEPAAGAPDPELVAAGEKAFRQCSTCHQVGADAKNRVGPQLNGIFGRVAGTVEGFRYSPVMVEAGEGGLVWDDETLHAFLADPRGYMRGTKMSFNGVRADEDIAALSAYLATFAD